MIADLVWVSRRRIEGWGKKLYAIGWGLREENRGLHITLLASMLLGISRHMYDYWYGRKDHVLPLDRAIVQKWSGELRSVSMSGLRLCANETVSSNWIDVAALAVEIETQDPLSSHKAADSEDRLQPAVNSISQTRTQLIALYFLVVLIADILLFFPAVHSPIEAMILILTELAGPPALTQTYDWLHSC